MSSSYDKGSQGRGLADDGSLDWNTANDKEGYYKMIRSEFEELFVVGGLPAFWP